jgi:hypothetical protein
MYIYTHVQVLFTWAQAEANSSFGLIALLCRQMSDGNVTRQEVGLGTLCLHLNPYGALSFCPKTDTKNIRWIYDYNCLAGIYSSGITTMVMFHVSATKTNKKTRTSSKRRALIPVLHPYMPLVLTGLSQSRRWRWHEPWPKLKLDLVV